LFGALKSAIYGKRIADAVIRAVKTWLFEWNEEWYCCHKVVEVGGDWKEGIESNQLSS
jgi:hypothetical protein